MPWAQKERKTSGGIWAALIKRCELCTFSGCSLHDLCEDHFMETFTFLQKGWSKLENGGSSYFSDSPWCTFALENHVCIGFPHVPHTHCDGKGLQHNFPLEERLFFLHPLCLLLLDAGIIDPGWWGASCLHCLVSCHLVEITMAGSLCFPAFWWVAMLEGRDLTPPNVFWFLHKLNSHPVLQGELVRFLRILMSYSHSLSHLGEEGLWLSSVLFLGCHFQVLCRRLCPFPSLGAIGRLFCSFCPLFLLY